MSNKIAISGWIHFNNLEFLENVLDKRQIQSQVLYENDSSNLQSNNDLANDDIETIVIEPSDDDDDCNSGSNYNYDYVKQQQEQQRLRLINQQKMIQDCCPHPPGDEIMHFFKSITPYLSMMDPTMKLRVRISIQEIILNEISRKTDSLKKDPPKDVKKHSEKGSKKKTDNTASNAVPKRVSKRVIKRNRKYFEK